MKDNQASLLDVSLLDDILQEQNPHAFPVVIRQMILGVQFEKVLSRV